MKRAKSLLWFLVLTAALVAVWMVMHKPQPVGNGDIPFRTDVVSRGDIAQVINVNGTINPEEIVMVGTQVSGQITKILAKVNDEVKKGQLLAEIDDSIPLTTLRQSQSNLETSQNAYELAQRDYERTRALVAKDFIAKTDLERAWQSVISSRSALQSAKIQVERDTVNLGYTKVISPIDGVIIAQEVTSGQTLASSFSTPNLFRVARSLERMKIDMNVPEADISKIHKGTTVQFTVDAHPDRVFQGIVGGIDLNSNNQSGVVTYNVVVLVDNQDRALMPGMTANLTITISRVPNVLKVPASALRFSPPAAEVNPLTRLFTWAGNNTEEDMQASGKSGQSIYLWNNGKLKITPVQIGASDDLYVEISGTGFKEGDVVVTGLKVQE